jgi:predicted acylesterase/phospholipase RssA
MTIKNIVIGGGGPTALISYGVIKYLHNTNYLDIRNIENFYGVSSGAILSVILIMNLDFNIIDDYILKRPWDKIFINQNTESLDLINYLDNKGIDGKYFINKLFKPLFAIANIDIAITLNEFYNLTNKALYVYGADINFDTQLHEVEISYKTFPDMTLLDALTITTAVPLIFKPIIYNDMCLIDGGVLNNFPLQNCINRTIDKKEIIAIKNVSNTKYLKITNDTDMFEYVRIFLRKAHNTLPYKHDNIQNIIICNTTNLANVEKWYECLIDNNMKKTLLVEGQLIAKHYLNNLDN